MARRKTARRKKAGVRGSTLRSLFGLRESPKQTEKALELEHAKRSRKLVKLRKREALRPKKHLRIPRKVWLSIARNSVLIMSAESPKRRRVPVFLWDMRPDQCSFRLSPKLIREQPKFLVRQHIPHLLHYRSSRTSKDVARR